MFRPVLVGKLNRLFDCIYQQNAAVLERLLLDLVPARSALYVLFDFLFNGIRERFGCRNQYGQCTLFMLRLRQKVKRNPSRIGIFIRDDQHLARAGH